MRNRTERVEATRRDNARFDRVLTGHGELTALLTPFEKVEETSREKRATKLRFNLTVAGMSGYDARTETLNIVELTDESGKVYSGKCQTLRSRQFSVDGHRFDYARIDTIDEANNTIQLG